MAAVAQPGLGLDMLKGRQYTNRYGWWGNYWKLFSRSL